MRTFSAKLAIPDSSAPVFMISNRSRNECRNVDKLFQEKDCRFYIHICLLLFLMDYDSFGGGLAFLWGLVGEYLLYHGLSGTAFGGNVTAVGFDKFYV